jgi:hypothetical protein
MRFKFDYSDAFQRARVAEDAPLLTLGPHPSLYRPLSPEALSKVGRVFAEARLAAEKRLKGAALVDALAALERLEARCRVGKPNRLGQMVELLGNAHALMRTADRMREIGAVADTEPTPYGLWLEPMHQQFREVLKDVGVYTRLMIRACFRCRDRRH